MEFHRDLVPRQAPPANSEDILFDVGHTPRVLLVFIPQDNVRNDNGTCDRTSMRPDTRHSNSGMAVDLRLHFLRIDLQSSNVDHTAPSSEEVVTVTTAFHNVTGIDKTIG